MDLIDIKKLKLIARQLLKKMYAIEFMSLCCYDRCLYDSSVTGHCMDEALAWIRLDPLISFVRRVASSLSDYRARGLDNPAG